MREATEFLFSTLIPRVASSLTAEHMGNVTRFLQQNGVNARFLGRVHNCVASEDLRAQLRSEMVARVIFKRIKGMWRAVSSHGLLPLLHIVVSVFNGVLEGTRNDDILDGLQSFFGPFELKSEPLNARSALPRAAELAGVVVDLKVFESGQLLSVSDLSLKPRVKELGFSAVAEADALFREAKSRVADERARVLLGHAAAILRRESVSKPRSSDLQSKLCKVLLLLLKRSLLLGEPAWRAAETEMSGALAALPFSFSQLLQPRYHRVIMRRKHARLEGVEAWLHWRQALDALAECRTESKVRKIVFVCF